MSNNPKKPLNKWLALINIPMQMGIIIYLFSILGTYLDSKILNKHHIYVKIATLLGVALAFYNLNRQLKDINSEE